jgi:hypothetical protein
MVDSADLTNRLLDTHWEMMKDYPNKEGIKLTLKSVFKTIFLDPNKGPGPFIRIRES